MKNTTIGVDLIIHSPQGKIRVIVLPYDSLYILQKPQIKPLTFPLRDDPPN